MTLTFFTKQAQPKALPVITYDEQTQSKRLFVAIAAGLVELINANKIDNINTLMPFLKQHAIYYPRQLPKHIQNLAPHEQLNYLLIYTRPHAETLYPSIAFTLQQMAVDAIARFPGLYGNLLLTGKTLEMLRKEANLDHTSVLQALADEALGINIYLERYPEPYLLPVKEYYLSQSGGQTNLHIHYQDNYYKAQTFHTGEDEL